MQVGAMSKITTSFLGLLSMLRESHTFDDITKEVKELWTEVSLLSSLFAQREI